MDSSAYDRGIKAASIWKRLTGVYFDADSRFTGWSDSKGIPRAVGKSFVPFSVLILLTLSLAAGVVLSTIIILVAVFAYMLRYIQMNHALSSSVPDESTSSHGPEFRNGRDGFGYYYGADDSIFTSAGSIDDDADKKA